MNKTLIIFVFLASAAGARGADDAVIDETDVSFFSVEEPAEVSIDDIFFAEAVIPPGGYTIGPGDVLSITVYNVENISGQYSVRYDGYLDFPYVGQVRAAGVSLGDFNDPHPAAYITAVHVLQLVELEVAHQGQPAFGDFPRFGVAHVPGGSRP